MDMANRLGPLDFFDQVKEYARQELLQPLKAIPRWIGFGLVGSALLMLAGILTTIATLRVLQEETGSTFSGNLSWAPYALTLLGVVIVLALLLRQIKKRTL